jgi:hypothetical protein
MGLRHYLAAVAAPATLDLRGWKVSDQAVLHLARLKDLREVKLPDTGLTPQGVQTLKKALPRCQVVGTLATP